MPSGGLSAALSNTSSRHAHAKQHRGTVIVEQNLLSIQSPPKPQKQSPFPDKAHPQRKSTESLPQSMEATSKHPLSSLHRMSAPSVNRLQGSSSPHRSSPESPRPLTSSPVKRRSSLEYRDGNGSIINGSPDSLRSSISSLTDITSSVSNLAIVTSTEDRLLQELRKQISQGASRIHHLEKQVQAIPGLTAKVDDLEKERGKVSNDLLDSQEIIQSMKQRLSLLHEQNSQLVKLTHSEGSGSSEILRNRNALVASLTQIKKLQERVDTIPSLKAQLRSLTDENTQLKQRETELNECFPMILPKGVTRVSYKDLTEENGTLRERNQKLTEEVRSASERLSSMATSFDNLKKRMDKFESTRAIVVPLQQKIKCLEKVKDDIYQELMDVKLHQLPSTDIDTAHLLSEVTTLRKKNSTLQSKFEQATISARQEKEKLVLKMFELESLNINSQKFEVETQLVKVEDLQFPSTASGGSQQASTLVTSGDRPGDECVEDEMSDLPAESKIQMLKLNQLKVHSEQSRIMLQNLLAERDELEKQVEELQMNTERKSIEELERSLAEKDSKLQLARVSIDKLEEELQLGRSSSELSSVLSENKRLSEQITKFKEVQKGYEEMLSTQTEARKCIEEHQTLLSSLQKANDDKHRAEKRHKEGKSKLRAIAKELAGSVELLTSFQSQCSRLQKQVEDAHKDLHSVRTRSASYVAKLTIAEAENGSIETPADREDSLYAAKSLVALKASYKMVCQERDDLRKTVESNSRTLTEQLSQLQALKSKKEELETDVKSLCKQLEEISNKEATVSRQCTHLESEVSQKTKAITVLEEERRQVKESASSLASENSVLENKIKGLEKENGAEKNLRALNSDERNKLCQELETYRSSNNVLQRHLQKNEETLQKEMQMKREVMAELHTLRTKKLIELETQRSSLIKDIDILSIENRTQAAEMKSLENALTEKSKELSQEVSKSSNLLSSSQKEMISLRAELEKSAADYRQLRTCHQETLQALKDTVTHKEKDIETLSSKLKVMERSDSEFKEIKQANESLESELKRLKVTVQNSHTHKMELEASISLKDSQHRKGLSEQTKRYNDLKKDCSSLTDEIEAHKATIRSLQRHVDESETREVEHERLKQNFKQLEKALGHSSHDNKALFSILQQTLKELPSYSSEASRSLQDENMKLEQQVSVLSQWNDKHRKEIETLEQAVEKLENEKDQFLVDILSKDAFAQENSQLKQELKEVEMEVSILKRKTHPDAQEELKVRLDTQTHLVAVFNQHSTSLQKQVSDLQHQVQSLGGTLDRDKPVSPPPMPDVALLIPHGESLHQRSKVDLERENYILQERVDTMQKELVRFQGESSRFRRRSSSLHVMCSVPVAPINEELQVK